MGKLARKDSDGTRREEGEEKNAGGTKERNSASVNERGAGSRGYVFLADYRSRLKHRLLLQQLEVRLRLTDGGSNREWNLLFRLVADGGETAEDKNRRDGDTGGAAENQSTERGHATHGGVASDASGADRESTNDVRVGLEESLKERKKGKKRKERRGG